MEQCVEVACPTCGEPTGVWLDVDEGELDIESDCQVCCRPLHVTVHATAGVLTDVSSEAGW